MEVITLGQAEIPAHDADQTRKQRIMLYLKMIYEIVGGKRTE